MGSRFVFALVLGLSVGLLFFMANYVAQRMKPTLTSDPFSRRFSYRILVRIIFLAIWVIGILFVVATLSLLGYRL